VNSPTSDVLVRLDRPPQRLDLGAEDFVHQAVFLDGASHEITPPLLLKYFV